MQKIVVGLFFGGRSTEHEVSVISALQAFENFDKSKYTLIPFYVSKDSQFYSHESFLSLSNYKDMDSLLTPKHRVTLANSNHKPGFLQGNILPKFTPLDIAFPLFHGAFGEDGAIQGMFEIINLPYTGFNVTGSATAMDKVISKSVFQSLGLPVGKYIYFTRNQWLENPKQCLKICQNLKYPLFVKPADGGSTIGVNKVTSPADLEFNIEVAAIYSDKVLIEESFENCIEVNCAALGYKEITPSVCEMPLKSADTLTFEDKYLRGGKTNKSPAKSDGLSSMSRQIPAPISSKLTKQIQLTTIKVFEALEGCGVARIDYFVDLQKELFWINEINSPPGSLAYYLFTPLGIAYKNLLDRIISDGLERFADQKTTQHTFNTPLLQEMAKKA